LALTNSGSPINSRDLDENREWARNYPAEAAAWLTNAPDGKQRLAIAEIVCSELAQTNPAAAVTLAESCVGGGTNAVAQSLLDNLAQQWAAQDMQAASAWALAKPAGEQRDGLLQRIAIVESQANPADAARLIVQQMQSGTVRNEAAISVLYQWAHQDAAAAMAWAESFPPGNLRERAINEVKNVSAVSSGTQPAVLN
jgi:thioredoxin-like negative regulator of GroEL